MRTAIALVVVLGLSSIAAAQGNPVPVTQANSVQVTISGNGIFNGTVTCGYTGDGINVHTWMATVPTGAGVGTISVWAPAEVLPGNPRASIFVSLGAVPGFPSTYQTTTANLNGPTWNETAGGLSPFSGSATVRGM